MRNLFVTTCIAALAAGAAQAETNSGTIAISNTNNAIGMTAAPGASGTIVNASGGKITVDETYAPADSDNDGDLDGPLATGTNRFGIKTGGAFTGDVTNNGAITIEGNDSAGIAFGGALTGKLTTDGTISVTGDRSVGVKTGDITGPVRIAGTVDARGTDAMAASIEGNITGALVVQGSLSATGFRTTTPPADTSKLDADDLRLGGPALNIAGNVSGGVILAVPPADNSSSDNDEDHDGIDDSKEGTASVTSYGSAAAVQVGATDHTVTLGAVAGNGDGHGLVIQGVVSGAGTYNNVNGNGLVVGGLGGNVTIAGGITVSGKVQASSTGTSATATAIRIGSGATVPEIYVSGAVVANGANAVAVQIDAGANVPRIRNNGTIQSTGTTAVAIRDASGTLTTIDNSGAIVGAIDVSANTSGVRIGQTVVASGVTAPSIAGNISFGSGNDVLDIADGSVTGGVSFGGGNNQMILSGDGTHAGAVTFGSGNDIMSLAGTSSFTGSADFGGGTDNLTISGTSTFSGSLANSAGLGVTINGGRMDLAKGIVSLRTLNIGAAGTLGLTLDAANHNGTLLNISGDAGFAQGSKLALTLTGITGAEGRYNILQAGSVTGASNLTTSDVLLPFLYKSSLVAPTPTSLAVDITRKTTTELGLNRSQATAWNAIYTALAADNKVAGVFLGDTDGDAFRTHVRQMLPDHAGGAFEAVTTGARLLAASLGDPTAPYVDKGNWGWWIQQVAFGRSKGLGATSGYETSGWGISTGGEIRTRFGAFGVSLGYIFGDAADKGTANKVDSNQYEVAAFWRHNVGPLQAWLRGAYGRVDFKGRRQFSGMIGTEAVERNARGNWNGTLTSATGGVAYEVYSGRLSVRPSVAFDYFHLKEGGYTETGGGNAFNLVVAGRTSDEFAVTGAIAAGIEFGGHSEDEGWFRLEAEGGRRELVGGSLGKTTAHFTGGQDFTLIPEKRTSGWVGKLRAVGGGGSFRIGGEAGAEEQQSKMGYTLRVSLMIGL